MLLPDKKALFLMAYPRYPIEEHGDALNGGSMKKKILTIALLSGLPVYQAFADCNTVGNVMVKGHECHELTTNIDEQPINCDMHPQGSYWVIHRKNGTYYLTKHTCKTHYQVADDTNKKIDPPKTSDTNVPSVPATTKATQAKTSTDGDKPAGEQDAGFQGVGTLKGMWDNAASFFTGEKAKPELPADQKEAALNAGKINVPAGPTNNDNPNVTPQSPVTNGATTIAGATNQPALYNSGGMDPTVSAQAAVAKKAAGVPGQINVPAGPSNNDLPSASPDLIKTKGATTIGGTSAIAPPTIATSPDVDQVAAGYKATVGNNPPGTINVPAGPTGVAIAPIETLPLKQPTPSIVKDVYQMESPDVIKSKCSSPEYASGPNCQAALAQAKKTENSWNPINNATTTGTGQATNTNTAPGNTSDATEQTKQQANNTSGNTSGTQGQNQQAGNESGTNSNSDQKTDSDTKTAKTDTPTTPSTDDKVDTRSAKELLKADAEKRRYGDDPNGENRYEKGDLKTSKVASDNTTPSNSNLVQPDDPKGNGNQNDYQEGAQINGSRNQYLADKDSLSNLRNLKEDMRGAEVDKNGDYVAPKSVKIVDADGTVREKTFKNKSDINDAIADVKANKKDDRLNAKEARKDGKAANKVNNGDAKSIQNAGDSKKKACGNYGGADCGATQAINASALAAEQLGMIGGALSVNSAGNKANAAVAAKGLDATQADFAQSTIDTAKAAEKSEKVMIGVDTAMALMQTQRLLKHQKSEKAVGANADAARRAIETAKSNNKGEINGSTSISDSYKSAYKAQFDIVNSGQRTSCDNTYIEAKRDAELARGAAKDDPNAGEKFDLAMNAAKAQKETCYKQAIETAKQEAKKSTDGKITTNIDDNQADELNKQKAMAGAQFGQVLNTMVNTAKHVQAMMAAKAAQKIAQTQTNVPHFSFTPGNNTNTNPDDPSALPTPDTGALVDDQNTTADEGLAKGVDPFNPNPGDGVGAGPAGHFDPAAPQGMAGGGGGNPLGGGTSTTGAKSDDAGKQEAQAKNQGGGTYGSDDSKGSGYSRVGGGGGSGVGIDTNFADLLKKFLPGGEEDKAKKDDGLTFDADRGLASDKAAVLGRNKNIFDEVHKRYQQKSSEGAVMYSI